MDFSFSAEQQAIRDAVARLCERFGDDYWLKKEATAAFRTNSTARWPRPAGSASRCRRNTAARARHHRGGDRHAGGGAIGRRLRGASAVHMNIFGLHPVVVFGSDEQKQRWLPPLIAGKDKACFAVTEPDVGLDTMKLKTGRCARVTVT